ncbi:MAG: sugar ABC transporter ATP-binding protein [Sphaerochaetaceae bacterium]|nr:sugar ABC transporter ATP-binding protein [Sphaerochaetaceae bacterium]
MNQDILTLDNISKSFDNHIVLDKVSITFSKGQVYCLLGKNGAGKTTLMKTIMGIYHQDDGDIIFEQQPIQITSPTEANKLGIRMLYQEPQLIDNLSVADNIFLNIEPTKKLMGIIDMKKMRLQSNLILNHFNVDIRPSQLVKNLSSGQKQIVSIAKAVISNVKVLILDEPTASLSKSEIRKFLTFINQLKHEGITIIYISHHIEEVLSIADKIVIMRDSRIVDIVDKKQFNKQMLIEKMVGIDFLNRYPRTKTKVGKKIVELKHITNQFNSIRDISLSISEGEIVGLAGLLGSGKSSIAEIVAGIKQPSKGEIYLYGDKISFTGPKEAIRRGISYVSKEMHTSLVYMLDITQNIILGNWGKLSRTPFLNPLKCKRQAEYYAKKFRILDPVVNFPVRHLSVGTKKKIVLARSVLSDSKLIVLDDPSRFLDIPIKVELYNILNVMAHKRIGILLISSDIEELIGMCDRILVLHKGKIVKELDTKRTSSPEVLYYSTGGNSTVSNVFSNSEE